MPKRPTAPRRRPSRPPPKKPPGKGGPANAGAIILTWEDDPASKTPPTPVQRPAPDLRATALPFALDGAAPVPQIYQTGTPEFRYWAMAEALRRAADFWGAIVPKGTKWQVGATLPVRRDAGRELNAFYTRGGGRDAAGLNFFHDTVDGVTYFSGESPEVACHEFGHAVLDAVRPELFHAAFVEVAAFHESFGDMSAIMTVLQLQSVRTDLITSIGTNIYRNSRLSRLAEQLGNAIRAGHPDLVESDSLRNAVNSFFYRDPQLLPPNAPASVLSSEPHSFSRVFTSAFFEILAGIFLAQGGAGTEQQLLAATVIAGDILMRASVGASIVPAYFTQVAAHFVSVDAAQYNKKYRDIIKSAFVKRGILSMESASSGVTVTVDRKQVRAFAQTAATARETPIATMAMGAHQFGIQMPLYVEAPGGAPHFSVAPASPKTGSLEPVSREVATASFVEDLFRRGRVDVAEHADAEMRIMHPFRRKSHELIEYQAGVKLVRRFFDCGIDVT
ncbi:MAG TPA: hypothetical protein VGC72_15940 [Candidatus Elarobacter sp.]